MLARVRNRLAVVNQVRTSAGREGRENLVEVEYVDRHLPPSDIVLWELEPEAELIQPDGYPRVLGTAPMRSREFEALRRAVRWGALNAYVDDHELGSPIVAPLLGAVQVEDYQLVPVAKALSMPRVTLALFDDVGLGKTIEAGLVLTELIRRRRIRRALVLCPAWLKRQWQDEMQTKFGLDFAIVDRDETVALRRQLGLETNPWSTFPRVIASYHYLKQANVLQEFMLASKLADPAAATLPWDLLIVDEVHNCMPAAYGRDSDLARMLTRIGKLFEHKIFLSATPHNGFTRSFTGLLEQLDPVRFARKDFISAAERKRMAEVVVRRLKGDINGVDAEAGRVPRFVERVLQPAIKLEFGPAEQGVIRAFEAFRDEFKRLLAVSGDDATRTAGNFVVEVLSKRLLSCPYTFAHSWSRFRLGFEKDPEATSQDVAAAADIARAESDRDDDAESRFGTAIRIAGAWSRGKIERLRASMAAVDGALAALGLALDSDERLPQPKEDARVQALLGLIRDKLDPSGGWIPDERLIVFTEYRTTLDYLVAVLNSAFSGEPEGRILQFYGGMPEPQREAVKAAFNDPEHQVRILLCTDAASEGANLQETARMVLHFDLPWNPARIDQRNGRLDRHGQARDVLVYHFTSESNADLRFLSRLFEKLETIREELGAIGKVIDEAIARRFLVVEDDKPRPLIAEEKDEENILEEIDTKAKAARQRRQADLDRLGEVGTGERDALARFCQAIDFDPDALRETLEVALATSGEGVRFTGPDDRRRYRLSSVPREFGPTIDQTLRRKGGAADGALMAVQFAAEDQLVDVGGRKVYRPGKDSALLHLGHPLVRQAVQALAVSRFPGSRRYDTISRWTVTRGPVPEGADALVLITVEEMATNLLREIFHHWVSVLRFPVRGSALGDPLPPVMPAEERRERAEAPELAQHAKDLWIEVEKDVDAAVKRYAQKLEEKIRAKLDKEKRRALDEQEKLLKDRRKLFESQLTRETAAQRRELKELRCRRTELTLFTEIEEADRLDEARIEEDLREERARLEETLRFLEEEHRRIVERVIPPRYELPEHLLVYPVAVEIRFPKEVR